MSEDTISFLFGFGFLAIIIFGLSTCTKAAYDSDAYKICVEAKAKGVRMDECNGHNGIFINQKYPTIEDKEQQQ